MEGFACPSCNRGEIVMTAGAGRRMRYRHIPDLEIPADLELPTCSACGERWLDAESTRHLEVALEAAYRAELVRKAERSIEALRPYIPQRDLERLLGVSAGWLSKIKNGKETSAPMAALLLLLAERPHRLEEVRRLWAATPAPTLKAVEPLEVSIKPQVEPVLPSLFIQLPSTDADLRISAEGEASADVLRLVA